MGFGGKMGGQVGQAGVGVGIERCGDVGLGVQRMLVDKIEQMNKKIHGLEEIKEVGEKKRKEKRPSG